MDDKDRMIITLKRQNLALWIFLVVITILAIIGIILQQKSKYKGAELDTGNILGQKMEFIVDPAFVLSLPEEYDSIREMSEANYLKYLNRAYILIGTYPDCEMIKISANVERNEYNWSTDFYCDEGELYYSYFKDGEKQGRIAIDVSEFQKDIDWEKVKDVDVDVAIVRAGFRGYGSGDLFEDKNAHDNISGALDAGLEVGVYFFSAAINREEGVEEAKYVLNMIKGYDITQPIVIDTEIVYEDSSARSNNISVEERTAAVVGFCETIEEAGYTPMIYASRDQFIRNLDIDSIGKWEFWLAAYDTPVFPYHTEGYQYSPYGYVDGIDTQVDLDVWMR